MMFIIIFYLKDAGLKAIETNSFMKKNKDAYYQACQVMINENPFSQRIIKECNFEHVYDILKPFKKAE